MTRALGSLEQWHPRSPTARCELPLLHQLVSQRPDQLDAKLADSQPHVVVNIAMVILVLAIVAPFGFLPDPYQALHVVFPVSLREPAGLQHLSGRLDLHRVHPCLHMVTHELLILLQGPENARACDS